MSSPPCSLKSPNVRWCLHTIGAKPALPHALLTLGLPAACWMSVMLVQSSVVRPASVSTPSFDLCLSHSFFPPLLSLLSSSQSSNNSPGLTLTLFLNFHLLSPLLLVKAFSSCPPCPHCPLPHLSLTVPLLFFLYFQGSGFVSSSSILSLQLSSLLSLPILFLHPCSPSIFLPLAIL